MILAWSYRDPFMILPWSCCDPTLILLWSFCDPTVILQWSYLHPTVILPWSFHDLTLILPWSYHNPFQISLDPTIYWPIFHWRSFQIFKEIMTTIQRPPITSKTRSASPEKRQVLYDDLNLPNKAKSASPSKRSLLTSCLGQQRNSDISNITGGLHVLLSSWLNWLKTTTFLNDGGFFWSKAENV